VVDVKGLEINAVGCVVLDAGVAYGVVF